MSRAKEALLAYLENKRKGFSFNREDFFEWWNKQDNEEHYDFSNKTVDVALHSLSKDGLLFKLKIVHLGESGRNMTQYEFLGKSELAKPSDDDKTFDPTDTNDALLVEVRNQIRLAHHGILKLCKTFQVNVLNSNFSSKELLDELTSRELGKGDE